MKMKPLAVAVGSLLPVAAIAATITGPASNQVSPEFLTVQLGVTSLPATVALGAQYQAGDILTLTYNTPAKLDRTATNSFAFANSVPIVVAGGTEATLQGTFSKFAENDTSVSYRVQTPPACVGTDCGIIATEQPVFRNADISGDVTLSSSSQTATGTPFDAGAAKVLVDVNTTQFAYTFAGLSQTIDVESNRTNFVGGQTTAAIFSITASDALGTPDFAETGTDITVTLTGDFSWIDNDTGTNATGIGTNNIGGVNVAPVSASASQIVVTLPPTGGDISLSNTLSLLVPTQTVTASVSQAITSTTSVTASGSATGAFTLNGSTVTVYAVPTVSTVDNFIWLTNTGSSSGEVSLVVNEAGTPIDLGVIGTSLAGSEFDVTAAMKAAMASQGVTLKGGRVHLDIVTKVPASDVAISAAYNVGGDRVNLLTSLEAVHSIP